MHKTFGCYVIKLFDIIITHRINRIGITANPALIKKETPATYLPCNSVTVQEQRGLKINWLLKIHKLSKEANTAKRDPNTREKIKISYLCFSYSDWLLNSGYPVMQTWGLKTWSPLHHYKPAPRKTESELTFQNKTKKMVTVLPFLSWLSL